MRRVGGASAPSCRLPGVASSLVNPPTPRVRVDRARRLSVTTVSLMLVLTVVGIRNVTDNLAALGLAAIPSWIAVGFLYFLPLSLMMAELGSARPDKRGGIYTYMEVGLGPGWAFTGTWAYFVSNLIYLQSSCSTLVINVSLASTGRDVFEGITWVVPLLGTACCVGLTWAATRGVRVFSRFAAWAGTVMLGYWIILVVVAFVAVMGGWQRSATPYEAGSLTPTLDLAYFSTFSWLLFAVAGAEAAGPYIHEMDRPERNFPRAMLLAALGIGAMYVLGTVAVSFLLPVHSINKATAIFETWYAMGSILHLPPELVARVFMTLTVLVLTAAYVVWMESPIRAMFAEVPKGTFPTFLLRHDEEGTHHQALWAQAVVVCVLILVPLFSIFAGTSGSDQLISLLNDLTSLAVVIPYLFIAASYIRFRRAGDPAPYRMVRSTPLAVATAVMVFVVSALGYLGAGLFAFQSEKIDWVYVATVYLGPALLIGLGLLLRRASMRSAALRAMARTG